MKRIIAIVIVAVLSFVLFGCNVAPNVPGVTPYATNGSGYNGWNYNNGNNPNNSVRSNGNTNTTRNTGANTNFANGNFTTRRDKPQSNPYNLPNVNTNKGLNTTPFGGVRQSVNPADKALLPGA